MRKRVGFSLVAVLMVALVWNSLRRTEPDPVIDGRPLTSWLDANDGSHDAELRADRAVRRAGTNAVPILLRMLRERDSALKTTIIALAEKQHLVRVRCIPAMRRNADAWVGFEALGTNAQGAVPALMEIYDRRISMWSQLYAIKSLGAIGPAAKMATPLLVKATTNAHFMVRTESVYALASVQAEPKVAVLAMTKALGDQNHTVREVACVALAKLGDQAKGAIPALVRLLGEDPNREVRHRVVYALQTIDPDAAARAGAN
jgi:HEAT repeat protein